MEALDTIQEVTPGQMEAPATIQVQQGSKGIWGWPINQFTSYMIVHKITPSVDNYSWLNRLDTQLNEPTSIFNIQ